MRKYILGKALNVLSFSAINLIGVLAGIMACSLAVAAPGPESETPMVVDVRVEGVEAVKESEVLLWVKTIEDEPLSFIRLREDVQSIWEMGKFRDVKVDVAEIKKGVKVTFIVSELPLAQEIKFEGNEKKKDKKLLEQINILEGDHFDDYKLAQAARSVEDFYHEEGFSLARVAPQVEEGKDQGTRVVFQVSEGDKIEVDKIVIEGNKAFSDDKVRGKLKTEVRGRFHGLFTSGKYEQVVFDQDLLRISEFYRNEGYAKARVVGHKLDYDPENPQKMWITIEVEEGLKYKMGEIAIDGNINYSEQEIRKVMRVKSGDTYKQEKFRTDLMKIGWLYAEKGFIYVQVVPEMKYDDEKQLISVGLSIDERRRAYIEKVRVIGNYNTKDYVILREVLLKPGDLFDSKKLARSQEKLFNLYYFDEVDFDTEPGSEEGQETLLIRVREKKTGTITFGMGYSTTDKLVGFLKVAEINLLGRGKKISGEWEFGKRRSSWKFSFREPYLFNTRTSFGFDVWNIRRYLDWYDEKRAGFDFIVGRRLSEYWRTSITYTFQNVRLTNLSASYFSYGQLLRSEEGTISSLTPFFVRDSRNSIFDPSRGSRMSNSTKISGLGGDFKFVQNIFNAAKYYPLFWRFAFGQHIQLGASGGYGGSVVPLFEYFYAGGTDTVRGYDERQLGDRDSEGGRAIFVSNSEIKFPVARRVLTLAVFMDGGRTWKSTKYVRLGQLVEDMDWGFGVGIRFMIPGSIMVLRLDYAWPFAYSSENRYGVSKSGKFHFNLGNIF